MSHKTVNPTDFKRIFSKSHVVDTLSDGWMRLHFDPDTGKYFEPVFDSRGDFVDHYLELSITSKEEWARRIAEDRDRITLKNPGRSSYFSKVPIFYDRALSRDIVESAFPDLRKLKEATRHGYLVQLYYSAEEDLHFRFGPNASGDFAYFPVRNSRI
jgi:hypothetical protein